ncbi:MAG: SPOR domain-containing protein [Acidobacteriota bacterium]|jgi:cell division septation protein DedD|nr:SPOR domain-containing protein [Acidobacteriota bacterium]
MKNNETREFELVLGNRQLLSGFFIVVLLFGVAFAMGYIVGRNSAPSAKLQAEAAAASAPQSPDARPEPASPAPAQPPAVSADQPPQPGADLTSATPPSEVPPQPATQPAQTPTQPASAPPTLADLPAAADSSPGSFWQVIATANRTSAEALLQSLRDKGFPVTLSPGPNNLVRVLVGPYTDTQAMGRAKTQLEDAGFHPVRK